MEKYSLNMRIMHWVMAILIITLLIVGNYMVGLPHDDPGKANIYMMHKSFGVLALLLVMLRLSIRLGSYVPVMPSQINQRDVSLHNWTVVFLYAFMFAMPIAGYTMSVASGHPVAFFGLQLPSLLEKNDVIAKLAYTFHTKGWWVLLGFILLHLAGNTKHYIVEKVNLLPRMW